jgi:predicted phosphate transport protein (TIGR00153 family)
MVANIFGASPVVPLEKHIGLAYKAARELPAFFGAAVTGNWDEAERICDRIIELEQAADDLKKQIRLHLPRSLFMPVPRGDLLELLMVQDKVANRARSVAVLVTGRKLEMPAGVTAEFLEFVDRNVDAVKQARKSVRELDELYTTGFRGAEVSLVESLIEELDKIETDTDEREVQLRASLFELEDGMDPVDVMFLYRVIELTGEIADQAERVGRRLELLYAH